MGTHTNGRDIRDVLDSIRRIVSALRLFDREAEIRAGISGAQLFVLQQLDGAGGISVNELADRTHTHQSSVSVVVDKLVHRNLVRRQPSRRDRRSVELWLSPQGRKLLRTAPAAAQERMITALAEFPPRRRRQLAELLVDLIRKTGIEGHTPTLFFEDKQPHQRRERGGKP
jgi:DNA-binding MarR family transcriptional regulator